MKHFYLLCLYVDRSHRTGSTSRTLFELPRWNYSFTFRSGTWNSQNFLTLQLPFWMLTKKKHSFQTLRSLALLGTHSKTLHNTRRGCLNFFCVPRRNWNKKLPRPIRRKSILLPRPIWRKTIFLLRLIRRKLFLNLDQVGQTLFTALRCFINKFWGYVLWYLSYIFLIFGNFFT